MIYESLSIVHIVEFINEQGLQQIQLAIPDSFQYEGSWVYFHLTSVPMDKFYIIYLSTQDYTYHNFQYSYNSIPFQYNQLNFYYGNSKRLINRKFRHIPPLASFRGQIALYLFQIPIAIGELHMNDRSIRRFELTLSASFSQTCWEYINTFQATLQDNQLIKVVDPFSTLMNKSYLIKGWFKQEGKLKVGKKYEFIDIFPAISLFGYDEFLQTARFKLHYYKPSFNTYQFLIETYSFKIPNINIDPKTIYYSDLIQIDQTFSEWHYISVKLSQSTLEIIISMKQVYQKSIQVKQYSKYDIEVNLAKGFKNQNINLQVQSFQFILCEENILNIDISRQCYSTCLTCSGPSSNDCESCNTNRCEQCTIYNCPSYCRILISKQCVCHFGYFDMNQKCYGIADTGFTLEGSNQVIEYNNCLIGYFKYNGQCFRCPEIMNLYVRSCMECQLDSWIQNSYCSAYFKSYNEDPNQNYYGDRLSQTHLYLFQYDEFILCEFCTYFDAWSDPSPVYWTLDHKYTAVLCQMNYDIVNGRCGKVQQINIPNVPDYVGSCHSSCYKCTNTYCTSCYDNVSTYLNLFKPQECIPCVIENCKYCFDYQISNPLINSFLSYIIQINYDDIITGCALCLEGFTYNFQTRKCEDVEMYNNCNQAIISYTNQQICLVSDDINSQAYQYLNCEQFIENCSQCTNINNILTCAICSIGYRYSQSQNKCNPCLAENPNYYQCSYQIQPPQRNIDFVGQIQGFYYYLTNSQLAIPQNILYIYGLECTLGQYNFNGYCYYSLIDSCDQPQFNSQTQYIRCLSCEPPASGVRIKGTQSSLSFQQITTCEPCVYYCKYCVHDETLYSRMNNGYVAFNNEPNKCVISQDNKHIDLDYGRVKAYPEILVYERQNLGCQNISEYYRSYQQSWNPYSWELQYLDQLSFDKFVKEITIIDNINGGCFTYISIISDSTTNYWIHVFTIKEYFLIFKGLNDQQNTLYLFEFSAQFANHIEFYYLKFEMMANYTHVYQYPLVSILHKNIHFKGISEIFAFKTQFTNYNSITMINVLFQDLNLYNNSILQQNSNKILEYSSIVLENVTFQNCQFTQSNFIVLLPQSVNTNIQIKQLIFEQTYFSSSLFMEISDQLNYYSISIKYIIISNCTFESSNLFQFSQYSTTLISNVQISNSVLKNSNLITFFAGISIDSVNIDNLRIVNSTLFSYNTIISVDQLTFTFTNFKFNQVTFSNSKIIHLQLKDDSNLIIRLTNLSHFDLIGSQSEAIYNIIRLSYSQNAAIFTSQIIIENLLFDSDENNLYNKLSLWPNCFDSEIIPPILEITKFENILISGLVFKNQILKDIIGINLNLESNVNFENITLKNIKFDSNLLVHQSGGQELKFIKIYSKKPIPIYLNEFNFYNNFIHGYYGQLKLLINQYYQYCQ